MVSYTWSGSGQAPPQPEPTKPQVQELEFEDAIEDEEDLTGMNEEEVAMIQEVQSNVAKQTTQAEDIDYNMFTINVAKGSFSAYESFLDQVYGIVRFTFANFSCNFIPTIIAPKPSLFQGSPEYTNPVKQMQARITVDSYRLRQLTYGSERHPDFLDLVRHLARRFSPPALFG